jgi:hypothetical protein
VTNTKIISPLARQRAEYVQLGSLYGSFPQEIILDTGTHVWMVAAHFDQEPTGALQVGTGLDSGRDADGHHVIAVPVEHVTRWLTEDEATDIVRMIEIDDEMGPTS